MFYYCSHYGESIRRFGPPVAYWTARFESKHRIAKKFAESANNVKNISKTLSERQQMRMASVHYNGMFDWGEIILPEQNVMMLKDVDSEIPLNREILKVMGENDILVNKVAYNGQQYETGDLISLDVMDCDTLEAGLIKSILVKNDQIYFMCRPFVCSRTWLQYFEGTSGLELLRCVDIKNLPDFKPLLMRGTETKFNFFLHHRISCSSR